MHNIACLVVDRLHWGYLGCYGNTWVATPAVDRLAAEGFVFSQALAESTDLGAVYDCLWRGTGALERLLKPGASSGPALVELARRSGRRTVLVTDEPLVAEHDAGAGFDEAAVLEAPPDDGPSAVDAAATHAARIFAEAIDRTTPDQGAAQPFFLWLHARAMGAAWDAPREFRDRYVEDEDPPAPSFTAVPREILPDDVDLDRRFGIAQAYAGQVTHVDACLGGFLEHLEESGLAASTIVVLLAPRGIALGEHQAVGMYDERLHAELVRTPCIVRFPDGRGRLRRSQALVQTGDWYHTLAELLDAAPVAMESDALARRSVLPLVDDPTATWRDRAIVIGPPGATGELGESGIRTAAWYLRRVPSTDDVASSQARDEIAKTADQLFAQPDDAWEANDVADRCHDIVDALRRMESDFRAAILAGNPLGPLSDELLHGRS